jgi:formamidopyrimidine-DNA glycosylase
LEFENGKTLALSDMRKFATVSLVEKNEVKSISEKLGPEPFDLKPAEFAKMARATRGKIKTVLMKPEFIAGIGNIYSDEIL